MFILEHKLPPDEKVIDETVLSFDNVLPLKYRSFFHVSTKKKGYSGVAAFIRQSGNRLNVRRTPEHGIPERHFNTAREKLKVTGRD